jgi:hypothetical protein
MNVVFAFYLLMEKERKFLNNQMFGVFLIEAHIKKKSIA